MMDILAVRLPAGRRWRTNGLRGAVLVGAALALPAWAAEGETRPPDVEGAIGLLMHHNPAFPGSSDFSTKVNPAGFLRWGRITVTGAGGFTTKRSDEVERGIGAELVRRKGLQVSLGLRFDPGRSQSDSRDLAGLSDIRSTVRARLSGRWDIDEQWRVGFGASTDALNRVGGSVVDATLARQWRLQGLDTWTMSVGGSFADGRYMQAWHGVTAEQAARSGYPAYQPGAGWRDVNVSGVWRTEFARRWAAFGGFAASRLLGPAADSPLTKQAGGWGLSGGVVWRF